MFRWTLCVTTSSCGLSVVTLRCSLVSYSKSTFGLKTSETVQSMNPGGNIVNSLDNTSHDRSNSVNHIIPPPGKSQDPQSPAHLGAAYSPVPHNQRSKAKGRLSFHSILGSSFAKDDDDPARRLRLCSLTMSFRSISQ